MHFDVAIFVGKYIRFSYRYAVVVVRASRERFRAVAAAATGYKTRVEKLSPVTTTAVTQRTWRAFADILLRHYRRRLTFRAPSLY